MSIFKYINSFGKVDGYYIIAVLLVLRATKYLITLSETDKEKFTEIVSAFLNYMLSLLNFGTFKYLEIKQNT